MPTREELECLHHGLDVRRWGIDLHLIGIEWVQFNKKPQLERLPALCTSGWDGLTVRLSGKGHTARYANGTVVSTPSGRFARSSSPQFTYFVPTTPVSSFLRFRIGARKTRHKIVEMSGSQVSSVVIEEILPKRKRDFDQVVVSSSTDD